MAFEGTVWVSDLCGTLGSALTSLTIGVKPDMVSSIEWDPNEGLTYTNKPFDFDACPTFGWSDPFTTSLEDEYAEGGYTYFLTSTIGPPYHPIVSPIPELYIAQPAYSQCSAWRSVGYRAKPFYGAYDPPRVLTPVSAMAAPTPSSVAADPETTSSATPQQSASAELPQITASPSVTAQPDTEQQPSNSVFVFGGMSWDSAHTALSGSIDTTKASHLSLGSVPSQSKDGVTGSNDPVITSTDVSTADPQDGLGTGSGLSSDAGILGGEKTDTVSDIGGGHASLHGGSITIPAAAPTDSPVLPSVGGQQIQTTANGTIVAGGTSIVAGNHAIVQGITLSNGHDGVMPDGTTFAKSAVQASDSSPKAAVITIDSSTYILDASSRLIIEGQTLEQGDAITIHSTPISYLSDGSRVVVGTSTQKLSATRTEDTQDPAVTFAGSTYAIGSSSELVIHGQTLTPGGAITVHSTPISYLPSGGSIVIGTSTQPLGPSRIEDAQDAAITFGGSTYTLDPSSKLMIQSQTLTPGGAVTVKGTTISFGSSNNKILIGTNTQTIPTAAARITKAPFLTFAGSTYIEQSPAFIIDGQTLSKGSVITVSGTPISLPSGGSVAVIGSNTQSLLTASIQKGPSKSQEPVITFAGSTYTEQSSAFLIDGQTLSQGSAITISGTPISLVSGDSVAVVGSSTQSLLIVPLESLITCAGQTYTASGSSSAFIIAGQTLTPGGVVTVSGTPISFAAVGTDVVVGSSTEGVQLGGYIMSAFGPGASTTQEGGGGETATATSVTTAATFTGNQMRLRSEFCGVFGLVGVVVSVWVVVI